MEGNYYKCEMALEHSLTTTTKLIATSTHAIVTTLKPNNGCKKK